MTRTVLTIAILVAFSGVASAQEQQDPNTWWLLMPGPAIPVPGDYDGDGKDDVATYRAGPIYAPNSFWRIWVGDVLPVEAGWRLIQWGQLGDIPVPKDYDGDGKTDLAVYRPSTDKWWILLSTCESGLPFECYDIRATP